MKTVKRLFGALALIISLTTSTVYSYIYKGMIWRKTKADGTHQYVFGAADYHVANKNLIRSQHRQVATALKRRNLKQQKVKVIVEDIDSYDGKDASVKAFDEVSKKKGTASDTFLGSSFNKFKKMKLPTSNVECRHAKTLMCDLMEIGVANDIALTDIPAVHALGQQAAQKLGLEFEQLSKHEVIDVICKAFNIKVRSIADELKRCMNEVKKYKDGATLSTCYKSIGKSIMSEGKKIIAAGLHLSDLGKTPWSCLQKRIPQEKQQEFINLIRNFNAPVLDVKALHEINEAQDADRIYLFMGGQHIKSIGEALEKMGYEKVYDSGTKRLVSKAKEQEWYQMAGSDRIRGERMLDTTPIYAGVDNIFFKLFAAQNPGNGLETSKVWQTISALYQGAINWIMSFFYS